MQQQLVGHFCNDSEYVVGIVPRDITCCFHFLTSMRSFTADRNGTIKLQGLWRRTACGVVLPVHLLGTSCTQLSRHTPGLREEPQHTAWRKRSWDICGLSQNSVDTNSLVTRFLFLADSAPRPSLRFRNISVFVVSVVVKKQHTT